MRKIVWAFLKIHRKCAKRGPDGRCVKPFVVARKVFQTSGSEAGARHTVRLFSIIRTAIINGLGPYLYLEYALENVGREPIEAILPYSKDLEIR